MRRFERESKVRADECWHGLYFFLKRWLLFGFLNCIISMEEQIWRRI